ncbi:MAG: hypothetical protein LBB76_01215 [Azoarcus sp.]|nr:hypothetical protein [Azoarcus sp.]
MTQLLRADQVNLQTVAHAPEPQWVEVDVLAKRDGVIATRIDDRVLALATIETIAFVSRKRRHDNSAVIASEFAMTNVG